MKAPSLVQPKKFRSPLKWHGGKSYLARRIIELFPPHEVYVEPFLGGGSVLLNKVKTPVEVAADSNWNLVSFWRDLQRRPDLLIPVWRELPYSQETFDEHDYSDPLAWEPSSTAFLVRNRMSRGGLGKDFAWSERLRGKTAPGGPMPGELNSWRTFLADLPRIADRIADVHLGLGDAVETIREHDGPKTLAYCDPPYLHETRTAKKAYDHEMTVEQHTDLLYALLDCSGAVALSGYRSELYDRFLGNWRRVDFDMPNHSGQGKSKQRRTECVWLNY